MRTAHALLNHFPDAGKMAAPSIGTDHLIGLQPWAAGHSHVFGAETYPSQRASRANGAATHQPGATPWELVQSNSHQP